MGQSLAIPRVIPNDWKRLDLIINKVKMRLGSTSSPTFAGVTVTGLTASTLIGANASKALESVTVGTGLNYTRPNLTLSHLGIEALTDPGADKILFWDDTASACKWLGMGNSVAITDVTLDTIQDIRTTATPTFDDLTISTPINIYALSHDSFADYDANKHIDHTGVTLTAGTGLTGGGDISANRTFAVDGVLEDLDTLGANTFTGDPVNDFLVGTAAGTLVWQYGATARTSMGVGTGDSPQFTNLVLTGATITQNTADGSDDAVLQFCGGGVVGNNRGGYCNIFGNEHATAPGCVEFVAGNIAGGDISFWTGNNIERITIAYSGTITIHNSLYLGEIADAHADVADYGQLWVHNDTPCSLWFTTDAGNDIQITSGTSIVVGSHTIVSHSDTTGTGTELNTLTGGGDVGALHTHAAAYQPLDAELTSLAALSYVAASFVKMTGANTFALRTIGETADDLQGTIDHDLTANYVADKHVAHAGVSITAGKGLSGGGTIAATRDIALDLTEMTGNVVWNDGSTDASITWTYALSGANDPVWTIGANSMDLTTGVLKVGGTTVMLVGGAPTAHLHDGDTLEHDAVNSSAGAFSFTTAGIVTFSNAITMSIGMDLTIPGNIIFNVDNSYIGYTDAKLALNGTAGSATLTGSLSGTSTAAFEGASVTVGKASTTTGTLVLHDSGSANTITLTVPNALAGSLSFTLPPTDGDNTEVLQTNGAGVLTWVANAGIGNHAMLDGSVHSDSVADTITRGSLIYGNATPKWDELDISTGFLRGDGTDCAWLSYANSLAAMSGVAGAAFSFNDQNITNVGSIAVDSIISDGAAAALTITATAGQAVTVESVSFDGGVVSGMGTLGCGAITSTATGIFEGASVTVGKASTTTGTIVLHDSGSANTITLTVPDSLAASLSFTLPPTDGDNTEVLQTNGSGVLTWVANGGGSGYLGYIKLSDTQAQNTHAGTFTKDAWRTRVLNTEDSDTNNDCSLAANQITLDAGTYECLIICPAYAVDNNQARLYNTTGASVILTGTGALADSVNVVNTFSFIRGRFTIAASQALEVQHYCITTKADNGLGTRCNLTSEVYTIAEFWRVS